MNQHIIDAVVGNILSEFPSANIYTGRVVQGVQADDIIINTVFDTVNVFKGSVYHQREVVIQVTVISPSEDNEVVEGLVSCLKSFTANEATHYPDSLDVINSDDKYQVLINLKFLER